MPSERHDFYCDGTLDAETVDELRLVDDDYQLLTGAGDHLFAQQRTAATFQKIERADLDLVRSVDSDVDMSMLR